VYAVPEALFLNPDTIAVGVQFTITDQSTGQSSPILNRFWDFGDGTAIANINPLSTHTPNPANILFALRLKISMGVPISFVIQFT
jgi:PKD repeat protein